ncbi:MAG: zapA [Clostridia bacterium]|jgi:cell division protein ZapA|nr:zapA [Clostridia bacterium]
MGKNKISVKIMEQEYVLVGEEEQEYYLDLAQKVDSIMREISKSNNRYNINMVAVLTALNLADALYKTQMELGDTSEKLEILQSEMQKPFEELNSLNQEVEAVKEQYTKTQSEYTKTQIELGKISREWAKAQEEMKDLSVELDVSRQTIDDLQNKLFENQIELLKVKKELDEHKSRSGYDKQDKNKGSGYKPMPRNQNK